MIKAIIFDFDGTILDTETPDFRCWQTVFTDHGARLEREVWGQVIGTGWDVFNPFDYLEKQIGRAVDRESVHALHREKFHEMIRRQVALPGVESVLATAEELGMKLAVASSSRNAWVSGHLERLGLLRHFSVVCTADDVERVKPDPALYLAALKGLGVAAEEAIAIEDSVNGVKAAKAAGLFCIAVPNSATCHMDFAHADRKMGSLDELDINNPLAG